MKNSSIESDNRENFDNIIDFDVIFAQNICFFDVSKNVANKIDSMKINKIMKKIDDEINDEIENVASKVDSLNIDFAIFVTNFF